MIVSSRKINTALISCFLIFFFAVANKLVVFGSKAGLWVYPYIADISPGPLIRAALIIPVVWAALYFSQEQIEGREPAVVFLAAHLTALFTLGLDAFKAFGFVSGQMWRSHEALGRAYGMWVFENLRNFFFNLGITQAVLYFFFSYDVP